jgi:hypothetical protein
MSEPAVLEQKVGHPSPGRFKLGSWRVFVPLVVPPIIFSAQIITSFTVADSACTRSLLPLPALVLFNLTAFTLLLAVMVLSLANRRAVGNENSASLKDLHDRGDGRTAFLVQFGLSMSALFVAVSLMQLTAIALLDTCVGFAPSV